MAENRFILRPAADIHVEHGLYPTEISSASILISEDTPDDDVGYIYATGDEIARLEQRSTWLMNGDIPLEAIKITQITAFLRGKVQSSKSLEINDTHYLGLNVAGTDTGEIYIENFTEEWITYSADIANAINVINEYINKNKRFPEINLTLRSFMTGTSMGYVSTKYDYPITQLYLEFKYEGNSNIGVFDKVNGKQKAATAVYQKVGGTWSEISDTEAKTILKNNNIRRG